MTSHLDTGAVVAVLRNKPAAAHDRLRPAKSDGASIGVSSTVLFDVWYGVARSDRRRENAERLRVFLAGGIDVLPFDKDVATVGGDLRAGLEATGTPIGPYEVLIAAHALVADAILVTTNVAEFARVRGLVWQEWSSVA